MVKRTEASGARSKLDDEIDALFRLPLAEFTGERNTLAARLKKEGRSNDAERVKLLAKPSVSAWAVNQLYWEHRDEFDELIATGKRLRPMQKSRLAGKAADMRDSLDARREALTNLSELATELLSGAGHSPSPDTQRRIVTTLEACQPPSTGDGEYKWLDAGRTDRPSADAGAPGEDTRPGDEQNPR